MPTIVKYPPQLIKMHGDLSSKDLVGTITSKERRQYRRTKLEIDLIDARTWGVIYSESNDGSGLGRGVR